MRTTVTIRDTEVKVTDVLRLLSQGFSTQQILDTYPVLVPGDVQASAKLALTFIEQYVTAEDEISLDHVIEITANSSRFVNLSKVRQQYPRAFLPWKTAEDTRLIEEHRAGVGIEKIARNHQRRPGAIHKRLAKLGLVKASGDAERVNHT